MNHTKAGWLYLILILAEVALVGLILLVPSLADDFMIAECILFAMMFIPFLIFMFATRTSFKEFFGFRKIRFSTIMWTLLFIILITPMSNFLNTVTALIFGNVAADVLTSAITDYPFIEMFLVIAIMGPVLEEMMFRGVLYRNFRKSGRLIGSVIVSAIIFGLYHRNLNQFFYTAYVGVMFSLIDEAADSVWPSIICHVIFNGYSVCLVYLIKGVAPQYAMSGAALEGISEAAASLALAVALVVLAFIGVLFLVLARLVVSKIAKNEGNLSLISKEVRVKDYLTGNKKIISVPLIIGICIAAAATIYNSVQLVLQNSGLI